MTKNKALDLAIKIVDQKKREYAPSADAARYGFRFGELAKGHYDELVEVINILEGLKDV